MDEDLVFALDIGTRNIIGIVGRQQGSVFEVEASDRLEHPQRAMIDGQIEDIVQVAKIAGEVKTRLEEKTGYTLHRVAVAAAGRALRTCRATFSMQFPGTLITARMMYELENNAVNDARDQLDTGNQDTIQYYCVGYSVVRYTLDGYPYTTLLDHRGRNAEVEIIATFLPTEVVDSLRRCMELLDLEVDTLTLEPIAAMRAVIPPDVRLLNLALVDIGAGTADIALSRDGTVAGYTMVTIAGDEITESLILNFLVDFQTAEQIKMDLNTGGPVHFTDILGNSYTMEPEEILVKIDTSVEHLAQVITERIEESNGGPPTAVFLVGGGSKTPGLCGKIADKLGLEPNRVAIAGTNFSGRILNAGSGLDGPEYATPVGIALTAADNLSNEGGSITVNGRKVRLFSSQPTSIMDALLVSGYQYSDIMGRNGRSLTFTLNGERTVIRGGQYSVAEIELDGKPAALTTPVEIGASIKIVPAVSGEDAAATIESLAEGALPITVILNSRQITAGVQAFLNGAAANPEDSVSELDDVDLYLLRTVGELCDYEGVDMQKNTILVNGAAASGDTILYEGDEVTVQDAKPVPPVIKTPVPPEDTPVPTPAPVPEKEKKTAPREAKPRIMKQPKSLRVELNGRQVALPPKPQGQSYCIQDMFPLIDLDSSAPGDSAQITLNGEEADPGHVLSSGDAVEIHTRN